MITVARHENTIAGHENTIAELETTVEEQGGEIRNLTEQGGNYYSRSSMIPVPFFNAG